MKNKNKEVGGVRLKEKITVKGRGLLATAPLKLRQFRIEH